MFDRPKIMKLSTLCVLTASLVLCVSFASAQSTDTEQHVLLIGGLGGNAEYTATFEQYLFETRRAFIDEFQVPTSHITVLAGNNDNSEEFIDDRSTADNIRAEFDRLTNRVQANDRVYIILFGHGSYDGTEARLNIPRRDLGGSDYAELLDPITAERILFVNTASSSGPFIDALSGTDRIIITATRSGRQRNETIFPRFFVEALSDPAADIDQNNRLSVREAFQYAVESTNRWFESSGNIPSEHALLDDTGDGKGVPLDELPDSDDGAFAADTYLHPPQTPGLTAGDTANDSLAANQTHTRELKKKIAALKRQKETMQEAEYYQQLEELLIRLARSSQPADSLDQN
jgi:hypothetical protein